MDGNLATLGKKLGGGPEPLPDEPKAGDENDAVSGFVCPTCWSKFADVDALIMHSVGCQEQPPDSQGAPQQQATPTSFSGSISVSVDSLREEKDSSSLLPSNVTYYIICVRCNGDHGENEWTVKHRFSEFKALHDEAEDTLKLAAAAAGRANRRPSGAVTSIAEALAHFPSGLLLRPSPEHLQERRIGLSKFLSCLTLSALHASRRPTTSGPTPPPATLLPTNPPPPSTLGPTPATVVPATSGAPTPSVAYAASSPSSRPS